MIPNIGIHYDERYWKNPEDFNPDRFSAEESAKRPNLAFMPFGEGPRNCIGRRYFKVIDLYRNKLKLLLSYCLDSLRSTLILQSRL